VECDNKSSVSFARKLDDISKYNNWLTPVEVEEILYTTGEDVRKASRHVK